MNRMVTKGYRKGVYERVTKVINDKCQAESASPNEGEAPSHVSTRTCTSISVIFCCSLEVRIWETKLG
jgi:hypothetical protein